MTTNLGRMWADYSPDEELPPLVFKKLTPFGPPTRPKGFRSARQVNSLPLGVPRSVGSKRK